MAPPSCGTATRRHRRPAPPARRPGRARPPLERGAEQQQPGGRRRCCRRSPRVRRRADRSPRRASWRRCDRRPVDAGDDEVVDLVRGELGLLQRGLPRLDAERDVAGLAEALLPHLRADVARRAPAIEELLGGRSRRGSASTGPSPSSPTSTAAAPSPPAASSGPPGSPVRRSALTTRVGRRRPRAARSAPTRGAHRADGVEGRRSLGRGAGRRARRWRSSCRGRRATVANQSALGSTSGARAAPGGPPRRPSWWCPRRTTPRCGCPCRRPSRPPPAIVERSRRR